MIKRVMIILLSFLFLAMFSSCGMEGLGGFLISDEKEVKLGESVRDELVGEYKLLALDDPAHIWATELVQGIANVSTEFRDSSKFGGYKVRVIKDDELVNAFAAPAGFTYISTGLILKAESCGEIAGVMSHELAHVCKRHSVKSLETKMSAAMLAEIVGLGEIGQTTVKIATGYLTGVTFSQDQEHEADKIGVQIMAKAMYNPLAMGDFFKKLDSSSGGGGGNLTSKLNDWFSSHPKTDARVSAVEKQVSTDYPEATRDSTKYSFNCLGTSMQLDAVKAHLKSDALKIDPNTGNKPAEKEE